MTPPVVVRLFPKMHYWIFDALRSREDGWFKKFVDFMIFRTPLAHSSETSWTRRIVKRVLAPVSRRTLPRELHGRELYF